jgi:hypothetical protein
MSLNQIARWINDSKQQNIHHLQTNLYTQKTIWETNIWQNMGNGQFGYNVCGQKK